MADRSVVLISGSVETEDEYSGLGDCRVGGHNERAQVRGL